MMVIKDRAKKLPKIDRIIGVSLLSLFDEIAIRRNLKRIRNHGVPTGTDIAEFSTEAFFRLICGL